MKEMYDACQKRLHEPEITKRKVHMAAAVAKIVFIAAIAVAVIGPVV